MADFRPSVARIDSAGSVLGAGFLVGPDLLATCAHVLGNEKDEVRVSFPQAPGRPEATGRLVTGTWRAPEAEDVAFLRLDPPPAGIVPLGLRSASGPLGAELRTFGFPAQAPLDGHPGTAEIGQRFTADALTMLALTEANALAQGFSGAPLVDEDGLVVGMVTAHPGADPYGRGIDLAYATPASVLQQIGPDLLIEQDCPYPGLVPFALEQADWFHGREHVVETLVDRLRERRGVLALFGSSGSGKSSLVAAGLLPALVGGAVPGLTANSQRLLRAGTDPAAVLEALAALPAPARVSRELLIIDQFEELLAHPDAGESATRILDELTRIATGDTPDRVLLVLRDDFFPRFSSRSPILMDHLLQGRIVNLTDELTADALRDIITVPARDQGWNVDPLLTDRLIRDLIDPQTRTAPVTDLPVLALTLHRIWVTASAAGGADNTLAPAHYDSVGGVRTAFASWCDEAYRAIPDELQPTARALVTALVQDPDPGQGTPAVRRRRGVADLTQDDNGEPDERTVRVLADLTDARIVTTARDPVTGEVLVELAHDTVIEHWQALHRWLEDDRDQRRWLDRIEDRARHWDETGRRGGLLEDEELAEAARRPTGRVPDLVAGYLRASRLRQRSRARTRAGALLAMVALTVLSLVAAGIAVSRNAEAGRQKREATRQRSEALRQRDVAIGNQVLDSGHQLQATDPSLAAQLELIGHRLSPSPDSAARLGDLARSPLAALLPGMSGSVASVAISPDGQRLASGDIDTRIQLSSFADPEHPITLGPPLTGMPGTMISAMAFSPDGFTLATGNDDGSIRLWDLVDPKHPAPIGSPLPGTEPPGTVNGEEGDENSIQALTFSPDGNTLASGEDGVTRLWNLTDLARPRLLSRLTGDSGTVYAVAFSPDGRTLAEGAEHWLQLWNLADPARPTRISTPEPVNPGAVDSLAFTPDGRTLASGSSTSGDDGSGSEVRLWNLARPRTPVLLGKPLTGSAVAISPDGRTLATGAEDGTIRRWNITRPQQPVPVGRALTGTTGVVMALAFGSDGATLNVADDPALRSWTLTSPARPGLLGPPLTGHTDQVESVAFSPDGATLASAADDGTIRLQDPDDPRRPATVLRGARASMSVVFSPDRRTLAATDGPAIRLWNIADPARPTAIGRPLAGHTETVQALAFNPAGTLLASAGDDQTIRLWNLAGPARPVPLGPPLAAAGIIQTLAFSPDGTLLAGAGDDGAIRLWNVREPTHPTPAGEPLRDQPETALPTGVQAVAFSPDGHTLAGVDDNGTIRLWDVTTRTRPTLLGRPLTNLNTSFYAVAFSPDGHTLAAGGDGRVRRWNLADRGHPVLLGQDLTGDQPIAGSVLALAFRPDGRLLAGGGEDRAVRLWDLDVGHAIEVICPGTAGNLTPEQWRRYVPELAYDPPCSHYPTKP